MTRWFRVASVVWIQLWVGVAVLAVDLDPPERYSLSHFYAPDHYRAASLSPDGRWVASFVVEDQSTYIVILDGRTGTSVSEVIAPAEFEVAPVHMGWMDADSFVLQTTEGRRNPDSGSSRVSRLFLFDVVAGEDRAAPTIRITQFYLRGDVIATRPDLDEEILMALSGHPQDVHRVRPRDHLTRHRSYKWTGAEDRRPPIPGVGEETSVARLPVRPLLWLAGRDGSIQLATAIERGKGVIWFRESDDARWRRVLVFESLDELDLLEVHGFTEDGRRIVVSTNRDSDKIALFEFDPRTRELGAKIFEHPDADVFGVVYESGSWVVIGAMVMEAGVPRNYYFRSQAESVRWLETRFEGHTVAVISKSRSGRQVVARIEGPVDPGSYYLLDLKQKRMMLFGHRMPWIDPDRMAPVTSFWAQAEGGPRVEAFLSMPRGVAQPHLIVMPHGGPIAVSDERSFDPVVQQFANLGYAVLKVNYRGSGGYGEAFLEQGLGEWGLGIEDDIDAAITEVVGRGLVSADRMCAVGGSYGGYSALMLLVRWPERFACGVTIAGVTDLALLFASSDWSQSPKLREAMVEVVGDPESRYEALRHRSPVFRTSEIQVPVLIVHGLLDQRVDIEHAARLRAMLEAQDKPMEWFELSDEGHQPSATGFARVFARVQTFLDDQLKGKLFESGVPAR